jgi:hypothetical protein
MDWSVTRCHVAALNNIIWISSGTMWEGVILLSAVPVAYYMTQEHNDVWYTCVGINEVCTIDLTLCDTKLPRVWPLLRNSFMESGPNSLYIIMSVKYPVLTELAGRSKWSTTNIRNSPNPAVRTSDGAKSSRCIKSTQLISMHCLEAGTATASARNRFRVIRTIHFRLRPPGTNQTAVYSAQCCISDGSKSHYQPLLLNNHEASSGRCRKLAGLSFASCR